MNAEGTVIEMDNWLLEFKEAVKHPSPSDLIFYPNSPDVTPEEIVAKALSYKPMGLN